MAAFPLATLGSKATERGFQNSDGDSITVSITSLGRKIHATVQGYRSKSALALNAILIWYTKEW